MTEIPQAIKQPEAPRTEHEVWVDAVSDTAVPVIDGFIEGSVTQEDLIKRLSTNIEIGLNQIDKDRYKTTKQKRAEAFGIPEKVDLL